LAPGVPIVNPRPGAEQAADPAVALPFLRKGFSFCHQLTFSAGSDIGGAVVGETLDGCVPAATLDGWLPDASFGVQLRCDSRVWPFGPMNDRSIVCE
jgi:hypothetical protein